MATAVTPSAIRSARIRAAGSHDQRTFAVRGFEDGEEREQLLLEHLPQVKYIARRIHDRLPAQVPLDDLIHAGVVGLIDAVEKFDPNKNVQLKSYAKFRIRGAILDSLREMDWSPRHLRRQARRVEDAHRDLKLRLGRVATEPELARELEMSLVDFQHLLGELRGLDLGSLQAESLDPQSDEDLVSFHPCGTERDPFFLCLQGELQSHITAALEDLDQKERQVVNLYYLEELTMKEVGAVLGVGESRISQIHSAAMIRLRARLEGILESQQNVAFETRAAKNATAGSNCLAFR
jgi:RNA polymerase sigma factor for flagellar operon FliA